MCVYLEVIRLSKPSFSDFSLLYNSFIENIVMNGIKF